MTLSTPALVRESERKTKPSWHLQAEAISHSMTRALARLMVA